MLLGHITSGVKDIGRKGQNWLHLIFSLPTKFWLEFDQVKQGSWSIDIDMCFGPEFLDESLDVP